MKTTWMGKRLFTGVLVLALLVSAGLPQRGYALNQRAAAGDRLELPGGAAITFLGAGAMLVKPEGQAVPVEYTFGSELVLTGGSLQITYAAPGELALREIACQGNLSLYGRSGAVLKVGKSSGTAISVTGGSLLAEAVHIQAEGAGGVVVGGGELLLQEGSSLEARGTTGEGVKVERGISVLGGSTLQGISDQSPGVTAGSLLLQGSSLTGRGSSVGIQAGGEVRAAGSSLTGEGRTGGLAASGGVVLSGKAALQEILRTTVEIGADSYTVPYAGGNLKSADAYQWSLGGASGELDWEGQKLRILGASASSGTLQAQRESHVSGERVDLSGGGSHTLRIPVKLAVGSSGGGESPGDGGEEETPGGEPGGGDGEDGDGTGNGGGDNGEGEDGENPDGEDPPPTDGGDGEGEDPPPAGENPPPVGEGGSGLWEEDDDENPDPIPSGSSWSAVGGYSGGGGASYGYSGSRRDEDPAPTGQLGPYLEEPDVVAVLDDDFWLGELPATGGNALGQRTVTNRDR